MNENRAIREHELVSLEKLRQQLGQILETMWEKIGTHHQGVSGRVYVPDVDIGETESALKIMIDLPGVAEKDVEVLVSSDDITIKGEKRRTREHSGQNYFLGERVYGGFRRTLPLPPDADGDRTTATLENGVLTVTVPKKTGSQRRAKKIRVASE